MAVRLSKIAREFNVGLSTIVEFLHSKGIKISSDPNAKLTDEDYALVAKEFSSDSQVKKESSLVDLKNTRKKKETVTIDNAGNISSGNENTEEEETVHYYLPLQCYRCSLFIADRAKRKAEEAEKPDYI